MQARALVSRGASWHIDLAVPGDPCLEETHGRDFLLTEENQAELLPEEMLRGEGGQGAETYILTLVPRNS